MRTFGLSGLLVFVLVASLLVAACGAPPATEAPAPEPTKAAEVKPTEASAPTEAPAPTEPPPVEEPKVLTVRATSDIMDLDPAFIPQMIDGNVSYNIHQGLITYPGTFAEVEDVLLAEPFAVSEDGLTISFVLREGIQWQKGYGELTAEDVKYSYERFLDPELDPPYRDDWAALDHVEVTGTYTGDIVLKEAFAPLWTSTMPVTAGWIVSQKAVEEKGRDVYATDPIGTGPYEFVEWIPNQKVILKRYEDYWGEPAEWDEVHFLVIPEDSAAEIGLESGELDFAQIGTDAVERFEDNPDFDVYAIDTPNYRWLAMNVQHPNLEDVNIRRAIRSAIDVDSIIEAAFDGKHARACALIAPSLLGSWPDAPCYERDVEKAKEYLAEAGVDSVDITLTYENVAQDTAIAEIVQANLAEVGINAELIPQDGGLFWEEGYGEEAAKIRQLTVMAYSTNPDPAWDTVWFTCDQVVEWNWMYWCNEDYDRLHDEGMVEMNQANRTDIYIEMQEIMDEDAHSVWISYPTNFYAVKNTIVPSMLATGDFKAYRFHSK